MLVVAYKNYSIAVHAALDFAQQLFRPDIEIRSKDGELILKMSLKKTFSAEPNAEAYGIERAKDWLDRLWEDSEGG